MKIALLSFRISEGPFALGYAALAQGLLDLGIKDVSILHLENNPSTTVVFPPNVQFKKLGAERARWAPFAVANYIREHQPDFLVSMPVQVNLSAIIGWKLSTSSKTKLLISERGALSYEVYIEHRDQIEWQILPPLARFLYPMASGIVCNGQGVQNDLLQTVRVSMPLNRIAVIPPAIDLSSVRQLRNVKPLHPWLAEKKYPVIAFVGRLVSQKNLPLLIDAFSLVRDQIKCKLIILGEGKEKEILKSYIDQCGLSEDISLVGYQNNPWSFVSHSDLFVLTSKAEAFGRVLVEAMACDTPVVVTDAIGEGPRSVVNNGEFGLLVPPDDKFALADSICQILTDKEQYNHYVCKGQERAEEYSPINVARKWLEFMQSL